MAVVRAFTLVEVALSMALTAVAILSLFLVIPEGFKAQRAVRYQILAATKAMELIDMLNANAPGVMHNARDIDKEGVYPWDGRAAYSTMAPDLETALESQLSVVKPLPEGIGRRLDSDQDEIAALLDEGGRLYYFSPSDPAGTMMVDPDLAGERNWFDATRSLIVGVVGNAQQNSILYYPATKLGPYQAFYPGPPTHGRDRIRTRANRAEYTDLFPYDATRDPAIGRIWDDVPTYTWNRSVSDPALQEERFGARAYLRYGDIRRVVAATDQTPEDHMDRRARAAGYLVPCLAYAESLGLDPLNDPMLDDPDDVGTDPDEGDYAPQVVGNPGTATGIDAFAELHSGAGDWRKVLAMRYLAHAGLCFASCYTEVAQLDSGGGVFLGAGGGDLQFPVRMTLRYPRGGNAGFDWAEETVNLARIRAWHEASIRMAMRHADRAGPYHWGAPRPLNRQVMMDHPLVELDLWSPPVTDEFFFRTGGGRYDWPAGFQANAPYDFPPQVVNNVETRRQWRAVYGAPRIGAPGRPFSFPGRTLDTNDDGYLDQHDLPVPHHVGGGAWQPALGDPAHFTLTAPFAANERAREVVFWSVDWQSYEDFESHPSAEMDGSRYPIVAPFPFPQPGESPAVGRLVEGYLATNVGSQRLLMSSMAADHSDNRRSAHRRQLWVYGWAGVLAYSTRNPEHRSVFEMPTRRWDPLTQTFTGAWYQEDRPVISEINDYGGLDEFRWQGGRAGPQQSVDITGWGPAADNTAIIAETLQHPQAYELWNKFMNLGAYGANRDGQLTRRRVNLQSVYGRRAVGPSNGRLAPVKDFGRIDRGSVPASVRMRATTVARFMYYDPRISGGYSQ